MFDGFLVAVLLRRLETVTLALTDSPELREVLSSAKAELSAALEVINEDDSLTSDVGNRLRDVAYELRPLL